MKEAAIQVFEDRLQIIGVAFGREQNFSPTLLAEQMSFARNIAPAKISAIAGCMACFNVFAVQLCQENVSDCVKNVFRRSGQDIGNTDQHLAFAQTNSVVNVGKGEELNTELGEGSAGPKLSVGLRKNILKLRRHLNRI